MPAFGARLSSSETEQAREREQELSRRHVEGRNPVPPPSHPTNWWWYARKPRPPPPPPPSPHISRRDNGGGAADDDPFGPCGIFNNTDPSCSRCALTNVTTPVTNSTQLGDPNPDPDPNDAVVLPAPVPVQTIKIRNRVVEEGSSNCGQGLRDNLASCGTIVTWNATDADAKTFIGGKLAQLYQAVYTCYSRSDYDVVFTFESIPNLERMLTCVEDAIQKAEKQKLACTVSY
ncbi:MAG: hypothetical protein M1838_001257 [Thelocarpon superellum]|nr:MAG: hypothetical protein M1838_001257 [Thelocarpon superellum]